jgi:hypothetical protein
MGRTIRERDMDRVAEERQRLSASWLNIVAAGVITAGSVAPLALLASAGPDRDARVLLAFCVACLLAGVGLHLGARLLIRPADGQAHAAGRHGAADS